MKQILLFASAIFSVLATASVTLTLSENGYEAERKIIARLYAKDIAETESFPGPGGGDEPTISIATIDLNRDGKSEIIAHFFHPSLCGSRGCTLVILSMQPNGGWKEIANLISQGDIEVRDEYRNNYRVIIFDHNNKSWVFQNGKYQ